MYSNLIIEFIFYIKLITDEIELIKIQVKLEKTFRMPLIGKSLYETIGELIKRGVPDQAEKMRKDFKISDSSET